jgi:hypothetical protein
MLGGKIWVKNNLGKNGSASGSTFFFTIPVCPPVKMNSFIQGNRKDNRPANLFKLGKKEKVFQHE